MYLSTSTSTKYPISAKMSPVEASEKQNENRVWLNSYDDRKYGQEIKSKFRVGDKVRITKN